jgi:hypothetical protein
MDREKMREVRWVKPETICEVAFNPSQKTTICVIPDFSDCD